MKTLLLSLFLALPMLLMAQNDHITHYNNGVKAHNNGDYYTALICYNKCLEIEDKYVSAYYNRALVYKHKKDYDKMTVDCNKAIELDAAYTGECNNLIGLSLHDQKKYKEAIPHYNKGLENTTDKKAKARIHYNLAWTFDKLRDNKNKLAQFEKAATLQPEVVDYQYQCGRAKFDVGGDTYKTAVDNFTKVIELDPKNKDGYTERAAYYMTFQKFDKALVDLKKAQELGADVKHLIEAAQFEMKMMEEE
jgi:tetratricopeptide (TPR) repeat protein